MNLDHTETTKREHNIYKDIESANKTESNLNTTFFRNSKFVIESTPEKLHITNKNSKHKMEKMIIEPDSFSGQGDIKTFILQYEKAAQINN
ncbi:Retrotrans gag domain-containing protein, partial [Aphis craccivora]